MWWIYIVPILQLSYRLGHWWSAMPHPVDRCRRVILQLLFCLLTLGGKRKPPIPTRNIIHRHRTYPCSKPISVLLWRDTNNIRNWIGENKKKQKEGYWPYEISYCVKRVSQTMKILAPLEVSTTCSISPLSFPPNFKNFSAPMYSSLSVKPVKWFLSSNSKISLRATLKESEFRTLFS